MNRTMHALSLSSEARKMTVVETAIPLPRPGEILVEVKVSAVNEMDVQVRAGGWRKYVNKFREKGPAVSGFEFAGVARSDGTNVKSGDRLIGYVHLLTGPRTHAQFICVKENSLCRIPDSLSFEHAAALVSMGLTAIEILDRLKPLSPGQNVLIIGAAGGVGIYTLQLAKWQGARVTAVCSQKNAAWIKSMGADAVRTYEHEPYFRSGDRFDLVVDVPCKTSFSQALPFLTRRGMYVCTNPFQDKRGFLRAIFSTRRAGYLLMLTTTHAKLKRLIDLTEQGALKAVIDSQHDLHAANEAFDKFARHGKQGRVLIRFDETTSP